MTFLRWRRLSSSKKLCLTGVLVVALITCIVNMAGIVNVRCSNEDSLRILEKLCEDYVNHRVEGTMCDSICYSKSIVFKKCTNYKAGKKVFLAECRGVCEKDETVMVAIKAIDKGHPFGFLELEKSKNKSLTRESVSVAEKIINDLVFNYANVKLGNMQNIFQKILNVDFNSFLKNPKYPGADAVAVETLWTLINQDEFLFMTVNKDSQFVPRIYGTCGMFYMIEFAPPGEKLDPFPSIFSKRKGSWRERADIALQILDICLSLDIDFHEPLHFCDVKEENFGINVQKQVKIIDTDSLFYNTSMMKDLSDPKCQTHEECDFFDCRGWCDMTKGKCVAKRTNNNLQNICEDIFVPRAQNFYSGLLVNPPDEIATELKQLLEDCAYPNKNKGEIVRSPTPKDIFWKLINLLKKGRKIS